MNREYLYDYYKRELEIFNKRMNMLNDGKIKDQRNLISYERFQKIIEPVAYSDGNKDIYSILPIYGTTIMQIYPINKFYFKDFYGFDISELEELVYFSKNTGKIQFMLGIDPRLFEDLDHYDILFDELNPPVHFKIPVSYYLSQEALQEYSTEFEILFRLLDANFLDKLSEYTSNFFSIGAFPYLINNLNTNYSLLKHFKYDKIHQYIYNLFLERNPKSILALNLVATLLVDNLTSNFNAIHNHSIQKITSSIPIEELLDTNEVFLPDKLPFEIGRFLIKKLTYLPNSFEACKNIIDYYDQNDVGNVIQNLNVALKKKKIDILLDNKDELDMILNNIWEETNSVNVSIKHAKILVPFTLALIGHLASYLNPQFGIISSLGLPFLTSILDAKYNIYEKIGKYGYNNYLVGIFDFKRKYPRTSS